ncbi:hypothetical protein [Paracoccus sediminicola]|uniref:hypothetical protein n=1 Tax=Paracoccus sediminicola TaxID=3017783 RepID=UPI0022EFFAEA|nr:hypothetical protein [Paracoccus sediminicola]WBU57893.1 hypothetical protein PAF18_05560 [Paracoccus sediminicola]
MRKSLLPLLVATVALPVWADASPEPIPDAPAAQSYAGQELGTAAVPAAESPALSDTVRPLSEDGAPGDGATDATTAAATPAEATTGATQAQADTTQAVTIIEDDETSPDASEDADPASDEAATADSDAAESSSEIAGPDGVPEEEATAEAESEADPAPESAAADTGEQAQADQPAEATQEGTQEEVGSTGAVATPETQPAPGEDATAPENAGNTGWTGGTGGAQIGTTAAGAVPQSKTWQPPVASGLSLKGEPRS